MMQNNPTLTLVPNYLSFEGDTLAMLNKNRRIEVLNIFQKAGFDIKKEGGFNPANPLELGIHAVSEGHNTEKRDEKLAKKVGIDMPKKYSLREALKQNVPIVAKGIDSSRGEDIHILETKEQKVRFITWLLLSHQLSKLHLKDNIEEYLSNLFSQIENGDFSSSELNLDREEDYFFEEYVENPGNYNNSMRIVADATGEIHYAYLLRSQKEKCEENLPYQLPDFHPLESLWAGSGYKWDILLFDSRSPFYIGTKQIAANAGKNRVTIHLNGGKITDPMNREVLIQHNIDPDNPQIPEQLKPISSELGRLCRGDYPHVGIDLIKKGRKWLLLEINNGTNLRPEAMGLPKDTSPEDCEKEMFRRVIENLLEKKL